MRTPHTTPIGTALFLAMTCFASSAPGRVQVEKKPAVVEHKTFDPDNPPKEMPALEPGEAAVTETDFQVGTNVSYRADHTDRRGERTRVEAKVSGVTVTLQLQITVWLPRGATDKLKAHEEGHRQIGETGYKTAEAVARAAADKIEGRRFTGEGDDEQGAGKAAVAAAMKQVSDSYLGSTAGATEKVNEAYDRLTDHGRNNLGEKDAIRQAFADVQKQEKETKASGTTRPARVAR